ncbi:DUF29 domain-containing protein [Thermochromatium tepidum]|uniref:DUF29 family protein n=1 Tax=Thermochromatium tepidum ATCC 43061 TaxID=316276 RepID=A0A6I6DXY4_THETI|nr:DUF29 domain-containing protein [Thermochromatium tepidum]QGU32424.1 DUF29 family protein [Thermochromatium tepidum ATCC 43061]
MKSSSSLYDLDIVAWANEQAQALRAGRFDRLDLEHLAEEIEDVGKSEQRELISRMAILIGHLLKWCYQPERRGASWESTIRTQRAAIARRLKRTPSLKRTLSDPDWFADAWSDGRDLAVRETGLSDLPLDCPWPLETMLDSDWLPENAQVRNDGQIQAQRPDSLR